MEAYFYCSYEHSRTGFFHTRLHNKELIAVDGGHEGLPPALGAFFSYDQFSVLWRDLCSPVEKPWHKPVPCGGIFGLREITGRFADGRSGTVNLAFYAGPEEEQQLRRIALTVLGDYAAFCGRLLSWMRIGGPCGYQLDGRAFEDLMQTCRERSKLHLLVDADDPSLKALPCLHQQQARVERELLKFAVCTCDWKTIAESMGSQIQWYLRPRCAITRAEFQKNFIDRAPLWELLSNP